MVAAQALARSLAESLTSMAELVQALAGVSAPLAGSQLDLPLLLTAATDELNAASFDLMQLLIKVPSQASGKRRPAGGAARNSPAPKKRSRARTHVPSPVVQADVAMAEALPDFVTALLAGVMKLLLERHGGAAWLVSQGAT